MRDDGMIALVLVKPAGEICDKSGVQKKTLVANRHDISRYFMHHHFQDGQKHLFDESTLNGHFQWRFLSSPEGQLPPGHSILAVASPCLNAACGAAELQVYLAPLHLHGLLALRVA